MKFKFLPIVLLIVTINTSAQQNGKSFNLTELPNIKSNYHQEIVPQKFLNYEFNLTELKASIETAPTDFENIKSKTILQLPSPDGNLQTFAIYKTTIMEAELASKYPTIQAFSGQGIDDPTATIKIDFTEYGFHAMVLSVNGTWFIDPFSKADTKNYLCYYKKDYFNPAKVNFTEDGLLIDSENINNNQSMLAANCIGDKLRTYRLAVACTGEYSQAVAGTSATTAQILSAIVTTVNRVSGVYEKELAIKLVLVASETNVIFLDPATDPFNGNNSSTTLISESQNVITQNIQSANFDIGHTFSTGGGGLATLGCVCKSSSKAKGITGSPSPTGDSYDIDYVAHEMGHQFGGNHTFNSGLGSCSGNRSANTAFEVGSGTTIMAYAGICSTDNTQSNSDAFFHSGSFDEIITYSNTGTGNTCAVATLTSNNPPTVVMPISGKAIPKLTPFVLTGGGNDPDGDAVTFCWEEMDKGTPTTWNGGATNTTAPLFKSRVPSVSGTRYFPSLVVIKANYPANPASTTGGLKGETLPAIGRNLNFRLTVRDNKVGGGGVANGGLGCASGEAFTIVVDGNAGPFKELVPNGGENYMGATYENITWDVANSDTGLVNCKKVDILYSTNGGTSFNDTLIANIPNTGSYLAYIPNIATNAQIRLMIKCSDNYFFDITDANLTITFNQNPSGLEKLSKGINPIVVSPNPTKNSLHVLFNNTFRNNNFTYQIQNSVGQTILSGLNFDNTNSIDVSGLSAGLYYIKTTIENNSFTNKFIKE